MTYTIAELNEAVQDKGFSYLYTSYQGQTRQCTGGGWHELEEALEHSSAKAVLPGIGTATIVESYGGGEGSGEERWFVFKVTDDAGDERTFRRNGYYASFIGSEFDGPTDQVAPAEKTITVWEAVK